MVDSAKISASQALGHDIAGIRERFAPATTFDGRRLAVQPGWRVLTRIVAGGFDAHVPEGVRYSRAS